MTMFSGAKHKFLTIQQIVQQNGSFTIFALSGNRNIERGNSKIYLLLYDHKYFFSYS